MFCDVHKMVLQFCCLFSNRLTGEAPAVVVDRWGYTGAGALRFLVAFGKGSLGKVDRAVLVHIFSVYIELV